MEQFRKQPVVMIIAFFAILAILNPVESECVPPTASFLKDSLTPVYPPSSAPSSDPPSQKESPAPSPDLLTKSESLVSSSLPSTGVTDSPDATYSPDATNSPDALNSPDATDSPDATSSIHSTVGLLTKTAAALNPFHKKEGSGIDDICSKTDFPPLCQSAVGPLLTAVKPDPVSVLQTAIKAAADKTKEAMSAMAKPTSTGSMDCNDVYDDAVTNLQKAAEALGSHDMGTVNSMLSAAMTDFSTCSDGFQETGGVNPLADLGDKLMKMASNCLAISSLIKG